MHPFLKFVVPGLLLLASGFLLGMLLSPPMPPQVTADPATTTLTRQPEPSVTIIAGNNQRELALADVRSANNVFAQLYNGYRFAAQQDTPGLLSALSTFMQDPDPLYHNNMVHILLERLTVADVQAALTFAEGSSRRTELIAHVVTSWIRNDPEPALDYFRAISSPQLKNAVGARLLEDPTLDQTGLLNEVREQLGEYGERIEEQLRRARIPAQRAFAEALEDQGPRRFEYLTEALSRWYREDPEAAIQRTSELANSGERQRLLQVVIAREGRNNPELALELVNTYAADNQNLRRQALVNLATQNPVDALPAIEAFVAETGNGDLLGHLAARWVTIDETAALAYLDTVDERYRTMVMQRLAYEYVRSNPERGVNWAMSLPDTYNTTVKQSALAILNQHPALAETWLRRLEDSPDLQQVLVQQVAMRRARDDPEAAYNWLNQYRDTKGYRNALQGVVNSWLVKDPVRASRTLLSMPDTPANATLYRTASAMWARQDSDAAIDWVERLPAGANQNAALSGLINSNVDADALLALVTPRLDNLPAATRMQMAYRLRREDVAAARIASMLRLSATEQRQIEQFNARSGTSSTGVF